MYKTLTWVQILKCQANNNDTLKNTISILSSIFHYFRLIKSLKNTQYNPPSLPTQPLHTYYIHQKQSSFFGKEGS